jgi:hypothetical protein
MLNLNTPDSLEITENKKQNIVLEALSKVRANYILRKIINGSSIKRPDTKLIMQMLESKRQDLDIAIQEFNSTSKNIDDYKTLALKILDIAGANYKEPPLDNIINLDELKSILEYLET